MRAVIGDSALPMSICPQVMPCARPSSAMDFVRPVMACFVAVYGAELGRGVCAEIEPLLMMRPPAGSCRFMIAIARCAHRNEPVRFVSTARCQCLSSSSSSGTGGDPTPALLNNRSRRPKRDSVAANNASTASTSRTSVGTTSDAVGICRAVSSSARPGARPARRRTRRSPDQLPPPARCRYRRRSPVQPDGSHPWRKLRTTRASAIHYSRTNMRIAVDGQPIEYTAGDSVAIAMTRAGQHPAARRHVVPGG